MSTVCPCMGGWSWSCHPSFGEERVTETGEVIARVAVGRSACRVRRRGRRGPRARSPRTASTSPKPVCGVVAETFTVAITELEEEDEGWDRGAANRRRRGYRVGQLRMTLKGGRTATAGLPIAYRTSGSRAIVSRSRMVGLHAVTRAGMRRLWSCPRRANDIRASRNKRESQNQRDINEGLARSGT